MQEDGDLPVIGTPIDFLGVNYYRREVIERSEDGGRRTVHHPDSTYTDMGWEVSPQGLFDLERLTDEYSPPAIHITENGAAFGDIRSHDGTVRDPDRQAYIAEHVGEISRAIEGGAPVEGYFVWSLLDNFEWANGYAKRFGIVYVDYATLERVPTSSFY